MQAHKEMTPAERRRFGAMLRFFQRAGRQKDARMREWLKEVGEKHLLHERNW